MADRIKAQIGSSGRMVVGLQLWETYNIASHHIPTEGGGKAGRQAHEVWELPRGWEEEGGLCAASLLLFLFCFVCSPFRFQKLYPSFAMTFLHHTVDVFLFSFFFYHTNFSYTQRFFGF